MKKILIDTRIWVLTLKKLFFDEGSRELALSERAENTVRSALDADNVLISSQLISEIFHVLTMRGRRIPKSQAVRFIADILDERKVIYRSISKEVAIESARLSEESCVHIWDFLVILPFRDEVDLIYSMDPHFRDCNQLQLATVENPLGVWKIEGED